MAVEVGSAYVTILPSMRGFTSRIRSGITGPAGSAGAAGGAAAGRGLQRGIMPSLGRIGGAMAGVFAVTKIVGFFKESVTGASDLAESASKVGVVFGSSSGVIQDFAKTAAKSMGMSTQAALEASGSLGNLFVALKLPQAQAATMSTKMVALAGDLASFNNIDPTEALVALRSGLVGETEPLRKLGVNMNDATLRAQAMKLGLIATTKDAMSPAVKAQAAYALILDQTKTAQGDFARTSNGLANRQRILAAQFTDLKGRIGQQLLPVVVAIAGFFVNRLLPSMEKIGGGVKTVMGGFRAFFHAVKEGDVTSSGFAGLMERIGLVVGRDLLPPIRAFAGYVRERVVPALKDFAQSKVIPALRDLADFVTRNKTLMLALAAAVGAMVVAMKLWALWTKIITIATKLWTAAQVALAVAITVNPITILVLAIIGLVAALAVVYMRSERFREVVQRAWRGIQEAADHAWNRVLKPALLGIAHFITGVVVPAILWWWHNVMEPAFKAIGAAVSWWWHNVTLPVFRFVVAYIKVVAATVMWLWHNIFSPAFAAISFLVRTWWAVVMKPILTMAWAFIRNVLAPVFMWLWRNVIGPAFSAIGTVISTVWTRVVRPAFEAVKTAVGLVGKAFGAAKDAIGSAWGQIAALAAKPINFVITEVYNKGIVPMWNRVAGAFGAPKLSAAAAIGPAPAAATRVRDYAKGGIVAGYRPGYDNVPAMLSYGEGILRPEVVRDLGAERILRWNRERGVQHFAGGGIVGAFDGILGMVTDPVGTIKKTASSFMSKLDSIKSSAFGQMIARIPQVMLDKITGWLKSGLGALLGGGRAGGYGGVVPHLAAVGDLIQRMFGPLSIGGVAGRPGNYSDHPSGHALDFMVGSSRALGDRIAGYLSANWQKFAVKYLIWNGAYAGAAGRWTPYTHPLGRTDPTSMHRDHVHMSSFDQGGWLPPGGVGVNLGRKPEAVLSPGQWGALADGGKGDTFNFHMRSIDLSERTFTHVQQTARLRARVGRPR